MQPSRNPVTTPLALLTVALAALSAGDRPANQAAACGGFFCQRVPINQAAEQIIFRQDGSQITAIVLIQYQGTAEDFSWIVPVPGIPDLSVVPGLLFQTRESATRPRRPNEVYLSSTSIPRALSISRGLRTTPGHFCTGFR